jgi:hypothetical protein
MSTTNENILKSLAALEQNLKDINSAKEQVDNILKTSENLAKVFELYQASFEGLSKNVGVVLEDSRKFNNDSFLKLSEQIEVFKAQVLRLEKVDLKSNFNLMLTTLTNQTDVKYNQLFKEFETVKNFNDDLNLRIEQQNKNLNNIKYCLFLSIALLIMSIILNIVL